MVSDPGWSAYRHRASSVGLLHEGDVRGRLDVARVEALFTDPCQPEGPAHLIGSTPGDLIDALGNVPFLQTENAKPIELGELSGLSLDVTVDSGALAACSGFGADEVALFGRADAQWRADPGERFRLQAAKVDGGTVAILFSLEESPAASVQAAESFYELASRISQTFRF